VHIILKEWRDTQRFFPREKTHPWLKQNLDVIDNDIARKSYAAAVSGVDDGVGQIMRTLEDLNLSEDTIVIYTADHGFCAGHHGMWGMGDHSRPLHMFDENLRVPLLFRHPARIAAGQTCDDLTCNYDFFPTILEYLNLSERLPVDIDLPGTSIALAFDGSLQHRAEEITFHEYENTRTARTRDWKLTLRHPDGPNELYHLAKDPGEKQNLYDSPDHAAIYQEMSGRLHRFFERHAVPEFDLWGDGRTKAGRILNIPV
jgi:arylsulfatase A-like enzyme